jgi:hypothetical protein
MHAVLHALARLHAMRIPRNMQFTLHFTLHYITFYKQHCMDANTLINCSSRNIRMDAYSWWNESLDSRDSSIDSFDKFCGRESKIASFGD